MTQSSFFDESTRAREWRERLSAFMDRYIVPEIPRWQRETDAGYRPPPLIEELKPLARDEDLWNLFLPGLRDDEPGTRLSNLEYAPLAELMGRVPWASEVFNCSAPDTGNMELLHLAATADQRRDWLEPLLNGAIRSCFAMTEPDVASSDATNIATSITRRADEYVVNGRKWFISGAADPRCRLIVVMGVSEPDAEPHRRHSMVLVPMDTPGIEVVRNIPVMNRESAEGHCELVFRNVRVPADNLLGEEGGGFALAQARLGPGRVHHCMRAIGQCELALELMSERALERRAFGRYLHEHGMVAEWIARSRIEIDQARLLVMKTAWLLDNGGNEAARGEVAMIKAAVPSLQNTVVNRAMQVFGAMGLSPDTPLADFWTLGRVLRIADGPDEVHLRTVARREIRAARERFGGGEAHLLTPEKLARARGVGGE